MSTLRYTVRPLSAAAKIRMSGKGTEISPFRANWSATEHVLERELRAIRARNVILEVNCTEADLRLDGQLRANARLASPHAALAFETPKGPLLLCCGRYRHWQDNVRGIALGLEALRKVERYGIIQSDEQYEGFRALNAGTIYEDWVVTLATYSGWAPEAVLADREGAYQVAVKNAHPDHGGSREAFMAVRNARRP